MGHIPFMFKLIGFLAVLCPVYAQTRAGMIEEARQEKIRNPPPAEDNIVERGLDFIKDRKLVERFTSGIAGLRVKLGGLATTSGMALGPEYIRRDLLRDRLTFRTSARASIREFYLMDLEIDMPRLAGDRAFLNLYTVHRGFPSVPYYGPGPDSRRGGGSTYNLEDTSFSFRTGVRPVRFLNVGVLGQYLLVNTGPGQDRRYASIERYYSPTDAPGLDRQSNFLQGGGFVQVDYRDNPGGPRRGGNYLIEYSNYSDRLIGRHNFDTLHLEAQQYIPFFNERRVIALRGRTVLTDPHRGNSVPFYLQPVIGGSETIRGYRPYRFYDNNSLVMNAEYRWDVFSGMDMALFYDAGKVFSRARDINLDGLRTSYGFGLRFNVRNNVFLRIDTGFSKEGFQTWFKFNNVF